MSGFVHETPSHQLAARVEERRATQRHLLSLAGWLTWWDEDGTRQTARIRTRDVSRYGAFIECRCDVIPLYQLVGLRLDEAAQNQDDLPTSLRQPLVPAVIYRIDRPVKTNNLPNGYALRLLVKPDRRSRRRWAQSDPAKPAFRFPRLVLQVGSSCRTIRGGTPL